MLLALTQHADTMGDDTGDEQLNLKVLGQDGQIVQVIIISLGVLGSYVTRILKFVNLTSGL